MYRGNLKQCISVLYDEIKSEPGKLGSIIYNPTGRYYTVMNEDQLSARTRKETEGNQRLVMRCTIAELRNILDPDQLAMQLGDRREPVKKSISTGPQRCDIDSR